MEAAVTDRARHPNVHPCIATYPTMVADAAGNRIFLINAVDFESSFDAEQNVILDLGECAHEVADIFGVVTKVQDAICITFWNPAPPPEAVCANGIRSVPFLFPDRLQNLLKI